MTYKPKRISAVAKEFNISKDRVVQFLQEKGIQLEDEKPGPNTKLNEEQYTVLTSEFQSDKNKVDEITQKELEKKKDQEELKKEVTAPKVKIETTKLKGITSKGKIDLNPKPKEQQPTESEPQEEPAPVEEPQSTKIETAKPKLAGLKTTGQKVDLTAFDKKPKAKQPATPQPEKTEGKPTQTPETPQPVESKQPESEAKPKEESAPETSKIQTQYTKLTGPKTTGQKVDLSQFNKKPKPKPETEAPKKKRKRIQSNDNKKTNDDRRQNNKKKGRKPEPKVELTDEQIQKQIKETLDKLTSGSKSKGSKHRRARREERKEMSKEEQERLTQEKTVLQVAEFTTPNDLASMMDVPVSKVIGACMTIGIMVTMNQRLDAETISIVVEEFGFTANFSQVEEQETEEEEIIDEALLVTRPPVVTVMGHVDHGKSSLVQYIGETDLISGEAGGITQHIGAYSVQLEDDRKITFLDTPGHEAFTAMRARGSQMTDIAIIVISAEDRVMPQTKEAIAHAEAAGIPIIFAINKIDKPNANPDKIKEELANMNYLVEDWGGKIQSHDISAKKGTGVKELLEKVLLEAEILELKAPHEMPGQGAVIGASLEKGRGYVTSLLVQRGTLRIGDFVLAGSHTGKIKAMFDERGNKLTQALPSTPVSVLGLSGAPQGGEKFKVYKDEKEAKQIALKRTQLQREHDVRTQKHLTLDEIGRRLKIGDFKELNLIIKGDVDGSVEALTDSLQKLSTDEIVVKVLHKGVGQITESDVQLAVASDAIILGFQVRPSMNAKRIAENESIEIRLYSVIYQAIDEIKEAMEGMLSPEYKEEIVANIEIRQTFKISKIGVIAGCMVLSGKISRNTSVRVIRDGVVVHTGKLGSLKRFKDDVKEVSKGYECGLNIENFNDIREGDIIEGYEQVAYKKTI